MKQYISSQTRLTSFVLIILLITQVMIFLQGCKEEIPPVQLTEPGPGPKITLDVLSGGEIEELDTNTAVVTVFRSLNMQPLVLSFSIDMPNEYYYAEYDENSLDPYQGQVTLSPDRKNAVVQLEVGYVKNGVPMIFTVQDKARKTSGFTINPEFRIDLSPDEIVDGKWKKTNFGFNDYGDIRILTGTSGQSIIAVSGKSVWKSSDQGITWNRIKVEGIDSLEMIRLHPSGDLYAVFQNKIARSNDNGNSWVTLITNLPSGTITDMVFYANGKFQIAFNDINNSGDQSGIWISEDCIHWSKSPFTWELLNGASDGSVIYMGKMMVINDSISVTEFYTGWSADKVITKDCGNNWKIMHPYEGYYLEFGIGTGLTASNGNLYMSTYNEIYNSEDQGYSWKAIMDGLPRSGSYYWVHDIAAGSDGNIYTAPDNFGVFVLEENETVWKSVGTELAPYNVQTLAVIDGRIYAAVEHFGLYVLE